MMICLQIIHHTDKHRIEKNLLSRNLVWMSGGVVGEHVQTNFLEVTHSINILVHVRVLNTESAVRHEPLKHYTAADHTTFTHHG